MVNDGFARRGYDDEMGVDSLVPINSLEERLALGPAYPARRSPATSAICDGVHPPADRDFNRRRGRSLRRAAPPRRTRYIARHTPAVYRRPTTWSTTSTLWPRSASSTATSTSSSRDRWAKMRPAQHRYRGGLDRDRAQGPARPDDVPQARRGSFYHCPRSKFRPTLSSAVGSGACGSPTSTRVSSMASTPTRPSSTTGSRPATTTTASSAPC